MPLYLRKRLKVGKEDRVRLQERLGFASVARPSGNVLWIHAASVGEANSVLPLITQLHESGYITLLTTGTVTSASLMQQRLPEDAIHQFVPIDTPQAVARFIAHWRPDMAIFVESELWPNMIRAARNAGATLILLNGRMSVRSFKRWKICAGTARQLVRSFALILAQTERDEAHFIRLGATDVHVVGNLKYAHSPHITDEAALVQLKQWVADRPCWVVASMHPREVPYIIDAVKHIKHALPHTLTVIVPRHPEKGGQIAGQFKESGITVAQRSAGEILTRETECYMADTLGELEVFYHLTNVVCMGGSFIVHGGQNPLEPARQGCALLTGENIYNFADIWQDLVAQKAGCVVRDGKMLAEKVQYLLSSAEEAERAGDAAKYCAERQQGVVDKVIAKLLPLLKLKQ